MTAMFGSATPLPARCEVRRLPHNRLLLSRARSDQVAHGDQPSRNADTGVQRNGRTERGPRPDQLQACPYRPFGVVLMGLGITKIHERTIAHVFRDEPVEAANGLGDAFLVRRNDLSQILQVHAG
jgi:hypothetical protein